jgi:hypothetical protein
LSRYSICVEERATRIFLLFLRRYQSNSHECRQEAIKDLQLELGVFAQQRDDFD